MTDNLIHRLEAAEGPSRELDARIQCAVQGLHFGRHCSGRVFKARRIFKDGRVKDQSENFKSQHYTGSLDAAVSLVPEGWEGQVNVNGEGGCWIDPPAGSPERKVYGRGRIYAHAATNPIALCIAALKAREAGNV